MWKLATFAAVLIAVGIQAIHAGPDADGNSDDDQGLNRFNRGSQRFGGFGFSRGNQGFGGFGSDDFRLSRDRSNNNFFSRFVQGPLNIGRGILGGFNRGAEIGLNAGARIAEVFGDAVEQFISGAAEISDIIAVTSHDLLDQSATTFKAKISALQQTIEAIIDSIGECIQRNILIQVQTSLKQAASSAERLHGVVNDVRETLRDEVEGSASVIIEKWNDWANSRLDEAFSALNGNGSYTRVENLLNDYINTYSGYLNQCVEEIVDELGSYETAVRDSIERYRKVIETLIIEVQICLRSANIQCQRRITTQLRTLRNAPREFSALERQGITLLRTDLENRQCVSRTLNEYENEQTEIQNKIAQIVSGGV